MLQVTYDLVFNEKTIASNLAGGFHASPAYSDGLLYHGFTRTTFNPEAPLICLNSFSGKVIWEKPKTVEDFGNCRTTPLIVGNLLIVAFSYADGLCIFDKRSGCLKTSIKLGQNVFQQWSSSVRLGENRVVVGRVDGVVPIIDLTTCTLSASVSLATPEMEEKLRKPDSLRSPENFPLYPSEPPVGGICGIPTATGHRSVVCGTTSGSLVRIDI